MLQLQQTIGNRAVGKLIQTKLKLGQPGDKYEQDADRVAEAVMRTPETLLQRQLEDDEEIRAQPVEEEDEEIQRQPVEEEEESIEEPIEQKGEEQELQRQPEEIKEEETLNAKESSAGFSKASPDMESNIKNMHGGGKPLTESERGFFESHFGHDFSAVRIHTDARAAETARVLNAKAFTTSRDIAFGEGKYDPDTRKGKKLLAHELTHVLQQERRNNRKSESISKAQEQMLQRLPIPPGPFERRTGPLPSGPPATATPAPSPPRQFTVPPHIEQAVNRTFQSVARNPQRYEYWFIQILLAPEYDRIRITLNFFIDQFGNIYRLLDTDLRRAIRQQFPDSAQIQAEVFNRVISNIANMLFLDFARQWDQRSPRFHRRLERERRQREERPPLRIRPGERLA
jgi:hypothetical protein